MKEMYSPFWILIYVIFSFGYSHKLKSSKADYEKTLQLAITSNILQAEIKRNISIINLEQCYDTILRSNIDLDTSLELLSFNNNHINIYNEKELQSLNQQLGHYGYRIVEFHINKRECLIRYRYYPTWRPPNIFSYWSSSLYYEVDLKMKKRKKWFLISQKIIPPSFNTNIPVQKWLNDNYNYSSN